MKQPGQSSCDHLAFRSISYGVWQNSRYEHISRLEWSANAFERCCKCRIIAHEQINSNHTSSSNITRREVGSYFWGRYEAFCPCCGMALRTSPSWRASLQYIAVLPTTNDQVVYGSKHVDELKTKVLCPLSVEKLTIPLVAMFRWLPSLQFLLAFWLKVGLHVFEKHN
jgi:hypothetical protein